MTVSVANPSITEASKRRMGKPLSIIEASKIRKGKPLRALNRCSKTKICYAYIEVNAKC